MANVYSTAWFYGNYETTAIDPGFLEFELPAGYTCVLRSLHLSFFSNGLLYQSLSPYVRWGGESAGQVYLGEVVPPWPSLNSWRWPTDSPECNLVLPPGSSLGIAWSSGASPAPEVFAMLWTGYQLTLP